VPKSTPKKKQTTTPVDNLYLSENLTLGEIESKEKHKNQGPLKQNRKEKKAIRLRAGQQPGIGYISS